MDLIRTIIPAIVLLQSAAVVAQQENVLDVGSRSQLLLDPAIVYSSKSCTVAFP
jgi:hypothetical protein